MKILSLQTYDTQTRLNKFHKKYANESRFFCYWFRILRVTRLVKNLTVVISISCCESLENVLGKFHCNSCDSVFLEWIIHQIVMYTYSLGVTLHMKRPNPRDKQAVRWWGEKIKIKIKKSKNHRRRPTKETTIAKVKRVER